MITRGDPFSRKNVAHTIRFRCGMWLSDVSARADHMCLLIIMLTPPAGSRLDCEAVLGFAEEIRWKSCLNGFS
jgi:hypothetical protein